MGAPEDELNSRLIVGNSATFTGISFEMLIICTVELALKVQFTKRLPLCVVCSVEEAPGDLFTVQFWKLSEYPVATLCSSP